MFKQATILFSAIILGVLTLFAGSATIIIALKMCPGLLYLSLGLSLTLLMGHLAKDIVGKVFGN